MRVEGSRYEGFTLIELMIVVAIIAAIAIPSLQSARKSALEAKAAGAARAIITAQEQYRTRFGTYAPTPGDLGNSGLIPQFAAGTNYFTEYDILGAASTPTFWWISVGPTLPGVTGDRYFYLDATGVIRVSLSGPATSTSPPLD